jgi:lysophospholipase L1-like esterase
MVPMTSLTGASRHAWADRWPSVVQQELGESATIIAEGLNGRTTVFDDPIDGPHKNGRTYLLPCLESHAPIDLVIIMLGTNDMKSRFNLCPGDIAAGAGQLVQMVSADVRGQNGIIPGVLLVCPPRIGPLSLFADVFAGAAEKSEQLDGQYRSVVRTLGCHYLNAGEYIASSEIDGIHLDVRQQHTLGVVVADYVQSLPG